MNKLDFRGFRRGIWLEIADAIWSDGADALRTDSEKKMSRTGDRWSFTMLSKPASVYLSVTPENESDAHEMPLHAGIQNALREAH